MAGLRIRIFSCLLLFLFLPLGSVAQKAESVDSLLKHAADERRNGSYDKALNLDLSALAQAKRTSNHKAYAAANNGVATDYLRIGDLVKSREYYNKALSMYASLKDTVNMGDQYYKIGVLDVEEGDMNEARRRFNIAIDIFTRKNNYPGLADVYNGFASMFYSQQNLDSVAWYAGKSLQYYRLAGNTDAESFMYINLGALFNSQKNHAKAIEYVNRGIQLADSSGLINQLRQGYKSLSETYAMIGDWKRAYENQKLFVQYNDSIFTLQKNEAMVKYDALYQTSEKEIKIQEQKTDLIEKESRLEAIRNTRNVLILFIAVAVFIALFFIYRYSTRKKINRLLDEKNAQLEEINSFKDRLFAIVSHDLRSPVTSFSRMTSALNTAIENLSHEEIKKYLSDIEVSAAELKNMLSGLLHWSLTQQSGAKVNTVPVLLSDCISEAVADCRSAMNEKKIRLNVQANESIRVLTDTGLLHIALRNVLSNAVKFSRLEDEISVLVNQDDTRCIIDVCDHGPGVPDHIAAHLFGKLSSDAPSRGGGFGLFISAELMKKMNGSIRLQSTSANGSVFRITLPLVN